MAAAAERGQLSFEPQIIPLGSTDFSHGMISTNSVSVLANGEAPLHLVVLGVNRSTSLTEQGIREAEVKQPRKRPALSYITFFPWSFINSLVWYVLHIDVGAILAEPDDYRGLALRSNQA